MASANGDSTVPRTHNSLRTVAAAAVFTTGARRWSRKIVQSTPPPLPLISLPPDDDWEEFDVPVKTGFGYSLPHIVLEQEETTDASASVSPATATKLKTALTHDRAAICRTLSEYMTQNEAFQVHRHGFGIDTTLVYKRTKSKAAKIPSETVAASSDELAFDAFFESGNLDRAFRVLGRHYATTTELLSAATVSSSTTATLPWSSPFPFFVKADIEYDLYCDTDVSTHGHIQWYYFGVTVSPGHLQRSSPLRVRFNIRNMLKKASLYNDGMLPAVYVDGQRGWHHAGANVCYFRNTDTYRHRKTGKSANYYTLSFVYEFTTPGRVFFAHCYPYTYSRLSSYLLSLQKDPSRNRFFRRRVLCKTIAGNICDVLTITDFGHEDDARSGVVFTARVHPGESNASFIMHGLIDYLTGPSLEAWFLRHRFVFKIVPMLNPDGVIHGNYRCSLAGVDLNRRYIDPSSKLHPTVLATKNMLLSMQKTRPISLYCDIHGHSRKKNMFLYGCVPFDEATASRADAAKLRVFPHILSKTCGAGTGGFYSLSDCTFSVSKSKKGTGRVVVWDEVGVLNSFTLEASFFGVDANSSKKKAAVTNNQPPVMPSMTHFMPQDLRSAGVSLALALIPFAHVLDRDRPTPPPPLPLDNNDVVVTRSELAIDATKAVRLAPLPNASGLNTSMSTPFLHSRSPLTRLSTPLSDSPSSSPRPFSGFGLFAGMDAMLTSLASTDDLLKEIEDALPENYAQHGDSDDDAESVGSESDPSGDNMEVEELQRHDSWTELVKETPVSPVPEPRPKLYKNRSATLLKRFSDSMLGMTLESPNPQPTEESIDPTPAEPLAPADPTPVSPPLVPVKEKPVITLAPVKTTPVAAPRVVRRHVSPPLQLHGHLRDRNKDIAALHLRAVQHRSRIKRTTMQQQRTVHPEQDIV